MPNPLSPKAARRAEKRILEQIGGTVEPKPMIVVDDHDIFDDADAVIAAARRSFTLAAEAEIAKNDQLGIPTHGSAGGKLIIRRPDKAAPVGSR
jgi:hypothetical protein